MASTDEVSSTSPCGTMPRSAPTVERMAAETARQASGPENIHARSLVVVASGEAAAHAGVRSRGHARDEEGEAERQHDDARELHDEVERVQDLGVDLLDVLGLVVDLGDVVFGAHVDDAGVHEAGVEEAAAHERRCPAPS